MRALLWLITLTISTPSLSWQMTDIVLMPWVATGIPSNIKQENLQNMIDAQKILINQLAKKSISISKIDQPTTVPKTLLPKLSNFFALSDINDEFKIDSPQKGILIQPFICKIADKIVVLSQLSAADRWTTLSIGSQILLSPPNRQPPKYNLSEGLVSATKKAFEKLKARQPYSHNLKISMHNESSGENIGDTTCLNLVLSQNILDHAPINSEMNNEYFGYLRNSGMNPTISPARSTRKFLIHYQKLNPKVGEPIETNIRIIESVFGQSHPSPLKLSLTLELSNQEIRFSDNSDLSSFISSESQLLAIDSMPEVLKKDRAWLYVDKGRAWGLKIGDRLETEGGNVKGHVVAYYGPEMLLKAKNGAPITEGAIVFVRKGQSQSTLGQTLSWDETTFPTPYPRKSSTRK
jgi:hypothetical protein